eukprot:CAMPEP_0178706590 /NCGR_PEP_ID=MMETSP0699-20121125/15498_1 /TAXON_ID=265572 /ORGANISM="Extubocellulus spinifer, Strain CCMP396" /LENGTH=55 /DNA_ID=CAMNT_0020354421 /DNA_START=168 /DNA_END=331 /DNA_ORIENTATION=+
MAPDSRGIGMAKGKSEQTRGPRSNLRGPSNGFLLLVLVGNHGGHAVLLGRFKLLL